MNNFVLTNCDLNRVGKRKETSLQSVTMTIGGAMIFRMDFKQSNGTTESTNSIVAGMKSSSGKNEHENYRFFWNIFLHIAYYHYYSLTVWSAEYKNGTENHDTGYAECINE